jgi:hypothetical protein
MNSANMFDGLPQNRRNTTGSEDLAVWCPIWSQLESNLPRECAEWIWFNQNRWIILANETCPNQVLGESLEEFYLRAHEYTPNGASFLLPLSARGRHLRWLFCYEVEFPCDCCDFCDVCFDLRDWKRKIKVEREGVHNPLTVLSFVELRINIIATAAQTTNIMVIATCRNNSPYFGDRASQTYKSIRWMKHRSNEKRMLPWQIAVKLACFDHILLNFSGSTRKPDL